MSSLNVTVTVNGCYLESCQKGPQSMYRSRACVGGGSTWWAELVLAGRAGKRQALSETVGAAEAEREISIAHGL